MMSTLPLAAALIDLVRWLDSLPYQVVGLCVAFTAVGLIWLLIEGLGLVLRWRELGRDEAARPRETTGQSQTMNGGSSAGVLLSAPPEIGLSSLDSGRSTALLRMNQGGPLPGAENPPPDAAESARQPSLIGGTVPAEVIVVISAAVHDWLEAGAHIVSIVPLERMPEQVHLLQEWSIEGRRHHFASHKVR